MSPVSAFLIAAALVSPFAAITFGRLWREKAARRARGPAEPVAPEPADPTDISAVIAALHDRLESAPPAPGGPTLRIPIPGATIGGRSADPRIVAALIIDDLRRRGIHANAEGDELHIGRATG